ncbi:MAG: dephospho-CoA kinase [Elusimicrobiota bacterium]
MKKPLIIGLTGGIGSGKTTVLKEFAKLGAATISSDSISRKIMRRGQPAWKKIAAFFGKSILHRSGSICRRKLGAIVFADRAKRKALEKITHPAIIKEIKDAVSVTAKKKNAPVIVEAPLLFEAGLEEYFDKTIAVWAPKKLRFNRIGGKRRLNKRQIEARDKAQMPLNIKRKMANYPVNNSGTLPETKRIVKKIWNDLTKK